MPGCNPPPPLNFNPMGPTGPTGAIGPVGPSGASGASGQALLMEAPSRPAAWSGTAIAGTTAVVFNGVTAIDGGDPTNYVDLKRQSIVICNMDPASPLLVRSLAHVPCGAILPQTEQILPVSEALEIYNSTAGSIACYIMEIWTCSRVSH